MTEVCVDAGFTLKLVLDEPDRDRVRERWTEWRVSGIDAVAPWLWLFESHAVLRRKVARRELTDQEASDGWRTLGRQGIRIVHPRGLFDRAWFLAARLGRPTTYDAVYLAVADLRQCEFWTADERLASLARPHCSWVRSLR